MHLKIGVETGLEGCFCVEGFRSGDYVVREFGVWKLSHLVLGWDWWTFTVARL